MIIQQNVYCNYFLSQCVSKVVLRIELDVLKAYFASLKHSNALHLTANPVTW